MIERKIRPCEFCPYKPIDLLLTREFIQNGIKLNCFDIDLVIEIGKRIEVVAEIKRYQDAACYDKFLMPAHEYVGLKKVAKSLRCDAYFIVHDGTEFYLAHVDRFERRNSIQHFGKSMIPFHRNEFRRLTPEEFKQFWFKTYGKKLVR